MKDNVGNIYLGIAGYQICVEIKHQKIVVVDLSLPPTYVKFYPRKAIFVTDIFRNEDC